MPKFKTPTTPKKKTPSSGISALWQAEQDLVKANEDATLEIIQAFGAVIRQSPINAAFDAMLLSAFAADAEIKAIGIEFGVVRDDYCGSRSFGLAEPRRVHAFNTVPPASLDDEWCEEHGNGDGEVTNRGVVEGIIEGALSALPGLTLCALLNGDALLSEEHDEVETLLVLTPDLQACFYRPGDECCSWEKM